MKRKKVRIRSHPVKNVYKEERVLKNKKFEKKTLQSLRAIGVLLALLIGVFITIIILNKPQIDSVPTVQAKDNEIFADELISEEASTIHEQENNVPNYIQEYIDINPYTVGYIKIDNTSIDYPVVQSDNNEYYINHNIYYDEDKKGAIFLDYRCDIDDFSKTRNVIIYGHRMKDGTMFKDLTKYFDEDFFIQNRIVKFDTINEELEWKVFAVFETSADFYYIDTEFPYDEMWLFFLNECNNLSVHKTNTNFYANDIVLTLSTCSAKENYRIVVMAKLLQ